jgi:hypothetical protein
MVPVRVGQFRQGHIPAGFIHARQSFFLCQHLGQRKSTQLQFIQFQRVLFGGHDGSLLVVQQHAPAFRFFFQSIDDVEVLFVFSRFQQVTYLKFAHLVDIGEIFLRLGFHASVSYCFSSPLSPNAHMKPRHTPLVYGNRPNTSKIIKGPHNTAWTHKGGRMMRSKA